MATIRWWKLVLWASVVAHGCAGLVAQQGPLQNAQSLIAQQKTKRSERFLAQRGILPRKASPASGPAFSPSVSHQSPAEMLMRARTQHAALKATPNDTGPTSLAAPWTAVGPSAVQTGNFGLISGRVTSIAVDPSVTSGNTVYVGTTGGGIWKSTNAAAAAGSVHFSPLTDTLPIFSTGNLASLSIGALAVQPPGGTGVVLAGTGDPNDASDSYYGTGILRSTDGGNTWSLIPQSNDTSTGGYMNYSFMGEGFAGFAWSTATPQLVVAAVAQSAEGVAVNAAGTTSFAGLYYSTDAGQTWQMATITDGPGQTIQSPQLAPALGSSGNSATSVTWNPVRQRFYAAVRYHGYYESTDGITFTRLINQPGVNLSTGTTGYCPANPDQTGSSNCPIFRGTITTQPVTGDLFALTVDNNNQDQGLWQDVCASTGSGCASPIVTFASQLSDTAIRASDGTTIPQGDYDLALVAVPSQQDTLLFVGTEDIFRCSLANSCQWRNTTNVNGCQAAQVAPSQHAIDATFGASGLMYFGNDGGLWRTTDGVGQQQARCSADDAAHFQNLNSGIGSLAEVATFSQSPYDENVFMAAMGTFGTASPQTGASAWAQVLDGEGDYNAIDPEHPQNWYATSAAPVSINLCTQGAACDKAGFGPPVIGNAQVGDDGYGFVGPAPWILDPQNSANLIIGTCRVWRGPGANSSAWGTGNALSSSLDGLVQGASCNGNAQVRSLAASGSPGDAVGTPEMIYAGMAGAADGGASVPGHIYRASVSSTSTGGVSGSATAWSDLSNSPVVNVQAVPFNQGEFDISSVYADPHDSTGNTVYVTLQGFIANGINGALAYRSTDGGVHWTAITNNLPDAPANSILVDPNDANTVYIALDTGVYVTRNISLCSDSAQSCWSVMGTKLPNAPVTQLLAFNYSSTSVLRAATYGRGIWQVPLLTSGIVQTTATVNPLSLTFAGQPVASNSATQPITITNSGTIALTITGITVSGDFFQQDDCTQLVVPGGTCSIQVGFAPTQTGQRQGVLTVFGNMPTGQVIASLTGTGLAAGNIVLLPTSMNFGNVLVGATAAAQNVTISNTGGVSVNLKTPTTTGDFQISANTCGTSLAPNFGCTISINFTPTASGPRIGVFSITDDSGTQPESTQTVQLSGNGQAKPTAVLSATSVNFSQPQTIGTTSGTQPVTLTNNGDVALTDIAISVSGDFSAVNDCGLSLIGHATCAISVAFVPTQVGAESGILTVNTLLGTQKVTLSGTGIAPPGVSATPQTVNFGSQGVATISNPAQSVTLTNNGGAALTGLAFAVADTTANATANEYAIAGSTCPSDHTLAVGSSCLINLTFTPATTGAHSGTFTVSGANLASPLNVALTGTGEDFQLQVSGVSSVVIVNGQTATYTIQVIPVSGSSGTVSLSCAGAPKNSTCTVNPATLPISSGVTGFATVKITTGVSSSASLAGPDIPRRSIDWQKIGVLAVLLPCVFPWMFPGRRKYRAFLRIWLVCLVTIALLFPAACGTHATGGASSTPPSNPSGPVTPSGVYTLTFGGAVPGLQRSVQVTLTVE